MRHQSTPIALIMEAVVGTSRGDPVSAELRSVEQEIDAYYRSNALVNLPFAAAAWHLMVCWEDQALGGLLLAAEEGWGDSSRAAFTDRQVFEIQYPFQWLWETCQAGGTVPELCDPRAYEAALQLLRLGHQYSAFAVAFTHASRGTVQLHLDGSRISASPGVRRDTRYGAYDLRERRVGITGEVDLVSLIELVKKSFRERGNSFAFDPSPSTVKLASEIVAPVVQHKFTLPHDWRFEGYSMGDFRSAWTSLEVIAYLNFAARMYAATRGIGWRMSDQSVIIARHKGLLRRLRRYSGVPEEVLATLMKDMTYGERGVNRPDPAIQPLIKLNDVQCGLMPSLVRDSSSERNLTVLLNRLPEQRQHYLRVVSIKEDLMRQRIEESLRSPAIRVFHGKIPGDDTLPDVDLALIMDSERLCVFLELKWFIEPAEVRELLEKSEEIEKGISQLLLLRQAIKRHGTALFSELKIDSTYEFSFAVVSANSIGHYSVQHPEVPVIRESHLIRKLRSRDRLSDVHSWLSTRSFLPAEGDDYRVHVQTVTIGQWSLEWPGIEPLFDTGPA